MANTKFPFCLYFELYSLNLQVEKKFIKYSWCNKDLYFIDNIIYHKYNSYKYIYPEDFLEERQERD